MRAPGALLFWLAATACGSPSPEAQHAPGQAFAAEVVPPPATAPVTAATQDLSAERRSAIVTAAARVAPAVVSVNVVRRQRPPRDDLFGWFFPRGYERLVEGLGSGFVIPGEGLVITNQHVVDGAEQIVITTRDGTDYRARLLGEDPLTDIAVLKVDARGLESAPIGRSTDLQIGEWVVAIGNPYGYLLGNTEPTVTAGVVSAIGRNLLPTGDQPGVYVGMIQTDASINPGNSGGPLANAVGEVVGVSSAIFTRTGGSVGIGFAIPIERALRVARELTQHGTVRRAWLGFDVAGADQLRAWKQAGGLPVTSVAEQGPGARAGLRSGDVLVSGLGRPLRTFLDLEAVRLDISPGDTLVFELRRNGRPHTARVVVEDLPTTRAEKIEVLGGLRLITVTPAIRQERGIRNPHGALIFEIGQETQRLTGLRQGDVIIQVNRMRVERAEDVQRSFEAAAGRGAIRVFFERGGQFGYADFYVR